MRCKQCDYPLWNLSARVCPECGRPFAPSEFEFIPSSVQFRCPHCAQEYYGTAPNGHVVPPDFDCVRCERHIAMDEMVLLPAAGLQEEQTVRDHIPWLERGGKPVRAWFKTVGRSLFQPGRLARSMPPEGRGLQAWWFAVLTHAVVITVGWLPLLLLFLMIPGGGPPAGAFASFVVGSIFAAAALIPLWGVLAHGILRLTGETEHPLGATIRTVCYASGADVILAVPCLGSYIAWIWSGVSAAIMLSTAQKVGGFRAALAAFLPPLAAFACFVMLMFLPAYMVSRTVNSGPPPSARRLLTYQNAPAAASAVLAYANAHGGSAPGHGAHLVRSNDLAPAKLSETGNLDEVRIGSVPLSRFILLSPDQERSVADAAAAALPKNVVAHRVGDIVFTYHGMSLTNPDPDLWLAVAWPDPDNPARNGPPRGAVAGLAGGAGVLYITPDQWPAQLAAQNALRAQNGLPPLPDPSTVTTDTPATAGP